MKERPKTARAENLLAMSIARRAHGTFRGNDEEKKASRLMIDCLEAANEKIDKFDRDAAINPRYAIELAEDLVNWFEVSERIKRVLANWDGGVEFNDALFAVVQGAIEELVRNVNRGGWASNFKNAVEHANRAGLTMFVALFKDLAEKKELPQQ